MTDFPKHLGADAPMAPMVRFASVSKRYGDPTVLDRLELDVAANEMVSIIGPSGSGKTTVLRLLMTLEEVSDGVIYAEGEPLTHMVRDLEGGRGRPRGGARYPPDEAECPVQRPCPATSPSLVHRTGRSPQR